MNTYLQSFFIYFENVIHPAAGKEEMEKKKKRTSKSANRPPATPDCLNIREGASKQNSFRRSPAP